MAKPTRERVRTYTHAHLPVSRRYTYTPELLAEGRRRYEQTEDRIVDIAADFGIHPTTFQRMANDKGWVRYTAPPRDLSRSAKLAAQAEALEVLAGEQSAAPPAQDAAWSLRERIDEMRAALDEEIAAVRTMRAQLKRVPQTVEAGERTSRTLANLMSSLERLHRLESGTPHTSGSDDYDDMPADIDAFRYDLARRIHAFVDSRTGRSDAERPGGAAPMDEV